jgi:hypothetical protein
VILRTYGGVVLKDESTHYSFPQVFATRRSDGQHSVYASDAYHRSLSAATATATTACCIKTSESHDIWMVPETSLSDGVMLYRAVSDGNSPSHCTALCGAMSC